MTLSKAVCRICRDVLFIWLCAVDVLLSQSWPSFLPRGDGTLLPPSHAVVPHGLGFTFYAKRVPDAQPHGPGLCSLPCRVGGELCAELSSTGFSSQNRGAPTPSIVQHVIPQGQSYTSLLPHVPLPLIPSNPPHFSPFAPLSPRTPFLPQRRIATKSHLGKEAQPRGLLRVGWCASRSNLLKSGGAGGD